RLMVAVLKGTAKAEFKKATAGRDSPSVTMQAENWKVSMKKGGSFRLPAGRDALREGQRGRVRGLCQPRSAALAGDRHAHGRVQEEGALPGQPGEHKPGKPQMMAKLANYS